MMQKQPKGSLRRRVKRFLHWAFVGHGSWPKGPFSVSVLHYEGDGFFRCLGCDYTEHYPWTG